MSGSGATSPFHSSGDGYSGDCNIIERVPLNSVQGLALSFLATGQELEVVSQDARLLALAPNGEIAGSLTPKLLAPLLRCIDSGHVFKAVILKIDGALVELEIRPK